MLEFDEEFNRTEEPFAHYLQFAEKLKLTKWVLEMTETIDNAKVGVAFFEIGSALMRYLRNDMLCW